MFGFDGDRPDAVVVAFLGDIGVHLPPAEAEHWKAHNIQPDSKGMSEVGYLRNIEGQFVDSERAEFKLVGALEELNQAWDARYGWELFKPPHELDNAVLATVRPPSNTSQRSFDQAMLNLAKGTVENLNEEDLRASLSSTTGLKGSINFLNAYTEQESIDMNDLVAVLRRIQGIRSKSAVHRKGSDFDVDKLLDGHDSLVGLFTDLLDHLVDGMHVATESLRTQPRE